MVNPGPDQPSHGNEFPSLEKSPPPVDPYAPVEYPSDPQLPPYSASFDSAPPLPPPNFPHSGFPPSGYPPPPMPAPGYPQYPGPGQPYSYDPYGAMRPPGTNGKAIASLVTSIVGMFFLCGLTSPVGVVLGVMGMRETKRTGQEGNGLAIAGVIVGAIGCVVLIVVIIYFVFIVGLLASSSYL